MDRLHLKALPKDVPEVGTIVEVSLRDANTNKENLLKESPLRVCGKYRARVVSVSTMAGGEIFYIEVEGMNEPIMAKITEASAKVGGVDEPIMVSVNLYYFLSYSQYYVNLAF